MLPVFDPIGLTFVAGAGGLPFVVPEPGGVTFVFVSVVVDVPVGAGVCVPPLEHEHNKPRTNDPRAKRCTRVLWIFAFCIGGILRGQSPTRHQVKGGTLSVCEPKQRARRRTCVSPRRFRATAFEGVPECQVAALRWTERRRWRHCSRTSNRRVTSQTGSPSFSQGSASARHHFARWSVACSRCVSDVFVFASELGLTTRSAEQPATSGTPIRRSRERQGDLVSRVHPRQRMALATKARLLAPVLDATRDALRKIPNSEHSQRWGREQGCRSCFNPRRSRCWHVVRNAAVASVAVG
jgi:hypothetical protein